MAAINVTGSGATTRIPADPATSGGKLSADPTTAGLAPGQSIPADPTQAAVVLASVQVQ
jgi:hypothetical protein